MFAADVPRTELKKDKRRTGDLRTDHSKVHFENERLSEALQKNLSHLASHKHKQWMARGSEIEQIRRTVEVYKAIKSVAAVSKTRKDLPTRPHTSSAYLPNRPRTTSSAYLPNRPRTTSAYMCSRAKTSQRATSQTRLKPRTMSVRIPNVNDVNGEFSDDSDDSSYVDDDPFTQKLAKSAPAAKVEPESKKNSRLSCRERKRTSKPFASMTPASTQGHPVAQARSRLLGSAGARSGFRGTPSTVLTTPAFSVRRGRSATPTSSVGTEEETQPEVEIARPTSTTRSLNVMCERTHKSLSRRELIAMTNVDRLLDDQRRPTLREALLEATRLHRQQLDERVRLFVESLDKLKKREAEKEMFRKLRIKETFD